MPRTLNAGGGQCSAPAPMTFNEVAHLLGTSRSGLPNGELSNDPREDSLSDSHFR